MPADKHVLRDTMRKLRDDAAEQGMKEAAQAHAMSAAKLSLDRLKDMAAKIGGKPAEEK